jgi:hypothetical protein
MCWYLFLETVRAVLFDRMYNAGSEVSTAVVMKCTVFWDITTCSPLKANRCFGGAHRLHVQGRISQENTSVKAGEKLAADYHLLSRWHLSRLRTWTWRRRSSIHTQTHIQTGPWSHKRIYSSFMELQWVKKQVLWKFRWHDIHILFTYLSFVNDDVSRVTTWAVSWYMLGETEEYHENHDFGNRLLGRDQNPLICWIRKKSATRSTATSGEVHSKFNQNPPSGWNMRKGGQTWRLMYAFTTCSTRRDHRHIQAWQCFNSCETCAPHSAVVNYISVISRRKRRK